MGLKEDIEREASKLEKQAAKLREAARLVGGEPDSAGTGKRRKAAVPLQKGERLRGGKYTIHGTLRVRNKPRGRHVTCVGPDCGREFISYRAPAKAGERRGGPFCSNACRAAGNRKRRELLSQQATALSKLKAKPRVLVEGDPLRASS